MAIASALKRALGLESPAPPLPRPSGRGRISAEALAVGREHVRWARRSGMQTAGEIMEGLGNQRRRGAWKAVERAVARAWDALERAP